MTLFFLFILYNIFGDKMNKKFLISVLLCFILGSSFAFIVYNSYKKNNIYAASGKEKSVYFIQIGAFSNYKNVNNITKSLSSYLVVEENNLYVVYVGITGNKNNLKKLEEFFVKKGNNIYIKEKNINNTIFIKTLIKYDSLLKETNDYDTIFIINKEVLNLYKKEVLRSAN